MTASSMEREMSPHHKTVIEIAKGQSINSTNQPVTYNSPFPWP